MLWAGVFWVASFFLAVTNARKQGLKFSTMQFFQALKMALH
jgi:2-phospho-L-lactate guanylyltransferase (CobY/MobA/RfbA family)